MAQSDFVLDVKFIMCYVKLTQFTIMIELEPW